MEEGASRACQGVGSDGDHPSLLVLYGSETGTAQDVAERVRREARRRGYQARCLALDAATPEGLASAQTAVFIVSTTGQGEAPSNMRLFWRSLLRRSLRSDLLGGLSAAVFGLGDSGYPKYNAAAKRLDRRLKQVGVKPLVELGLGDDQSPAGHEEALDPWLNGLWAALGAAPPDSRGQSEAPALDAPKFAARRRGERVARGNEQSRRREHERAQWLLDRAERLADGLGPPPLPEKGPSKYCRLLANLKQNERLTSRDHWQDVRHISLGLPGWEAGGHHEPGDLVSMVPEQSADAVDAFLTRCDLDKDELVLIAPREEEEEAAKDGRVDPIRIEDLVAGALDVNSASPRRYFFEVLSHFAPEELEREQLQRFASAEGREELHNYNHSERRTVLECLHDFSSPTPPLEYLLEIVPRLRARQFSISSSARVYPGEVHMTVAVVQFQTPYKRWRHGLCSGWLAGMGETSTVPVWLEQGSFRLSEDGLPVVLIGPGTGVAPLRSVVQERDWRKRAGREVAHSTLFFGCRKREGDYLYQGEWEEMEGEGRALEKPGGLFVAFSREQPQKRYVTHLLREEAARVWRAMRQGATFFVCGNAGSMPADVYAALEGVCIDEGGLDRRAAKEFLKRAELAGLLRFETWS